MSLRVLVADDSRAMRAVIRKTLHAAGFEISSLVEAEDGAKALEIVTGQVIDVALCDLHMPNMSGLELLRKLHDLGKVPSCFILVTSDGREDGLNQAMKLGARGYVTKPFKPEKLRKLLSLFVGEPDGKRLEEVAEGLDF